MTAQIRPTNSAYGEFLLSCIAEADREHSPEEVAKAEEYLSYFHVRERSSNSPQEVFAWNG